MRDMSWYMVLGMKRCRAITLSMQMNQPISRSVSPTTRRTSKLMVSHSCSHLAKLCQIRTCNGRLLMTVLGIRPGAPEQTTITIYLQCAQVIRQIVELSVRAPSLNPNLKVSNCAATSVHKSHVVHRMRRDLVNLCPHSRNQRAIAS